MIHIKWCQCQTDLSKLS